MSEIKNTNTVSLGCGTIILIALIVLILGNASSSDINKKIDALNEKISNLENQIQKQNNLIQEILEEIKEE